MNTVEQKSVKINLFSEYFSVIYFQKGIVRKIAPLFSPIPTHLQNKLIYSEQNL
jgi:hypothetical protein